MFQIVHTVSFLTGESFYFDCAFMRNESSACNFMYLMIGRIFLQTSFWLDTFQTLKYHDATWDPAPSCHVAGWVGTVGNKEYSWKPFLWEMNNILTMEGTAKHITEPINPKSMYSQLLYQTSKKPAVSLMPPDTRGVWQGSQNGERQCLNQLWLKSI